MNIGALRKALEGLSDDTPCCYDLWLPDDVREYVAEQMPDDAPITDDEVEDTLHDMFRYRDATIGTTWETLQECLPDSVKERM